MNILKQIKIGGFIYDVERPEGSFIGDNNNSTYVLDGEYSFSKKLIKVGNNGCSDYQKMVFLHEVCHAIIGHYCCTGTHDEENFVEQFSKGLYQVLVDNPDLFKGSEAENDN